MQLSERERRWLAEIEGVLVEEEPRLHRAMAALSSRPLRVATIRSRLQAADRQGRARIAWSALVLAGGVALLLAGLAIGAPWMVVAGMVTAQFGPWLIHRHRHRRTRLGAEADVEPASRATRRPVSVSIRNTELGR